MKLGSIVFALSVLATSFAYADHAAGIPAECSTDMASLQAGQNQQPPPQYQPVRLDETKKGEFQMKFEERLNARVKGQDVAVAKIASAINIARAGMSDPNRPLGSFIFLGPTGTGKTLTVMESALALGLDPRSVVVIDCAEYSAEHMITKLIGSPPSYIGGDIRPLLAQENLDFYHTREVQITPILFDEIEKASPQLWNLLLGILENGRLTLGNNQQVDFSKALVFMTSNVGQAEMQKMLSEKFIGFKVAEAQKEASKQGRKLDDAAIEALKKKFLPEFLNRIDEFVIFKPLSEEALRGVLEVELTKVQEIVLNKSNTRYIFGLTAAAKDYVFSNSNAREYGARDMRKTVKKLVVDPLAALVGNGAIRSGDLIRVDFDPAQNKLVFDRVEERFAQEHMAEFAKEFYPGFDKNAGRERANERPVGTNPNAAPQPGRKAGR